MISRIIKVEVGVISRSRRLRLITLTKTLIILDITKIESNNCFIIHWTQKLGSHVSGRFCLFTDGKEHESRKVDMITLGNHALRSCMTWLLVTLTWLPVTLTWLLYNLQLWCYAHWFRKFTVRCRPMRKELESSMYNNCYKHVHVHVCVYKLRHCLFSFSFFFNLLLEGWCWRCCSVSWCQMESRAEMSGCLESGWQVRCS